jgi:hypothetical protein
MHRPNLILRRHGALTFGLGYLHDGVWVDHLAAGDTAIRDSVDRLAAPEDATAIDVVHRWLSCCADPVERELPLVDRDDAVPVVGVILQAVAGTAER